MPRAYKNKPLSARQKLANKLISKKHYIVEQCFGTSKRYSESDVPATSKQ